MICINTSVAWNFWKN